VVGVLVAVLVVGWLTVGILSMSMLTTRLLVGGERAVVALAIVNERKEFIESLPYGDVGYVSPGAGEPQGVIDGNIEALTRNNQTYQLNTSIQYVDDPLTTETDDYKKVELRVEWTTAAGAGRDVQVVTYLAEKGEPRSCASCPDSRGCDATTGICDPLPPPYPPGAGTPCTPGLLCDNGELCPLTGFCPSGVAMPSVPVEGEACVPGRLCNNGALCPLSGVCPTASCPDWTCPSQSTCFNGFCYQKDWYDLTFPSYDNSGPADNSPMTCEQNQCETSLDCPTNCQSSCQYINSETFMGCGRWRVVRQCQLTWVPSCRAAQAGGASSSCRGGYGAGGSCSDLECDPVPCPQPNLLVDPNRSWCVNGQECNISSSNTACSADSGCPSGELCAPTGSCRTICPSNAACSYYWGGWTRGCSVEVLAEGPAGCSVVGGNCRGPAGSCAVASSLATVVVDTANVDPLDYDLVLADPVGVGEGDFPNRTTVAFKISLSQAVVDTLTARVELQDREATQAGGDYAGAGITLTFNPGEPQSQIVLAEIVGDNDAEIDESFAAVVVRAVSNAHEVQIGQAAATVLIKNDD